MKICISFALGCPRTEFDAFSVLKYLKVNNCILTRQFSEADLILISGCAVTKRNENLTKSLWSIAQSEKKPNAKIIYFGCFPGILSDSALYDYGGITVKKRQFNILDDIIGARVKYDDLNEIGLLFDDDIVRSGFSLSDILRVKLESAHDSFWNAVRLIIKAGQSHSLVEAESIYNVRISKGCNESCAYCAIRQGVGPLNSNDLNAITETIRRAVSSGHSTIRLIAEDVGSYGQDCNRSVVDLFKEIYAIPGDFKILIDDFNPRWLIAYFSELMEIFGRDPARLAHLGIPVQSGSNRILKSMQRSYDADAARRCLQILKATFPDTMLYTHIIVGFPGESIDDFNDTLNFMRPGFFDKISIYKYSDRPGTSSSCLDRKVSEFDKSVRAIKLIKIVGLGKVTIPS